MKGSLEPTAPGRFVIDLSGASKSDKLDLLADGNVCIYKHVSTSNMTQSAIVGELNAKFSGGC